MLGRVWGSKSIHSSTATAIKGWLNADSVASCEVKTPFRGLFVETRPVSLSTSDFGRFLANRLHLDPDEILNASDWAGTGNTIGALALRLGLLDLDQIDRILDMQDADKRLFGEIAVNLEFITEDQVEGLIQLQRYHQLLEAGEALIIRGLVTIEQLQESLLEYYRERGSKINDPQPVPFDALAALGEE